MDALLFLFIKYHGESYHLSSIDDCSLSMCLTKIEYLALISCSETQTFPSQVTQLVIMAVQASMHNMCETEQLNGSQPSFIFIICICAFPSMACQNVFHENSLFDKSHRQDFQNKTRK